MSKANWLQENMKDQEFRELLLKEEIKELRLQLSDEEARASCAEKVLVSTARKEGECRKRLAAADELLEKMEYLSEKTGKYCPWCGSIKGQPHVTCSGEDCKLKKYLDGVK